MKKLLIFTLFILISDFAQAQKDTLKMNAGFLFAPQAGLSLKDINSGFSGFYPLHLTFLVSKGRVSGLVFYTLNYNSLGVGLSCKISEKIGMYAVGTKSMQTANSYSGLGVTTPVKDGAASAFVECGNNWATGKQYLYAGLIIPYLFRVK